MSDWIETWFQKNALRMYEDEQEKQRQRLQSEKKQLVKNNRIIVKVNHSVIYDSKKNNDISDELYYALLSYGLKEVISKKDKNKKSPIRYELDSEISAIPEVVMNVPACEK